MRRKHDEDDSDKPDVHYVASHAKTQCGMYHLNGVSGVHITNQWDKVTCPACISNR
jgi:hypothetical protein